MKTIALKWKHPDAPIITADEAKVLSDQKQQVIFFEPLTLLPVIVSAKKILILATIQNPTQETRNRSITAAD